MIRVRDAIGRLMRRVGLHSLSGWWDAGTDELDMKRRRRHIRPPDPPTFVEIAEAGREWAEGHMTEREHLLTIINEGNGFTAICSCGWTGRRCESEMGAGMEWSMNHRIKGGIGVMSDD